MAKMLLSSEFGSESALEEVRRATNIINLSITYLEMAKTSHVANGDYSCREASCPLHFQMGLA